MPDSTPTAVKPLPKSRAVLKTLLDHCTECASYANRVRYRNQRVLLQMESFGEGELTFTELQKHWIALKSSQTREANNYIPDPFDLWQYCDAKKVARMEEFGGAGEQCFKSLGRRTITEAEAKAWCASALCVHLGHTLRTELLMGLKDRITAELEAQHASQVEDAEADLERSGVSMTVPSAASNAERWSEPDSPQQWARQFKFSRDTLIRRFRDGTIRHKKLSSKSYQIHLDDLPTKQ